LPKPPVHYGKTSGSDGKERQVSIFFHSRGKRFCRNQDGLATAEFSLLALTFLFIIGIIVDFGHYCYLRQVVTTASREGARYGSLYAAPRITATQIQTYVRQKYGPSLGYSDCSGPTVSVVGAGGASGTDLTVTVTGTKNWFFLDSIISRLTNANSLHHPAAATVMKLE
jgi:Flp pilus assembly protein TadG